MQRGGLASWMKGPFIQNGRAATSFHPHPGLAAARLTGCWSYRP